MMVLMKCPSSISMIKPYKNKIVFFFMISGLLLILFGCAKNEYPRPTNQYYVNDYANILYQATRSSITREGERLYEVSQDEVDGGAQIVVATFVVDNLSNIANYDKTEIFRQWEIGKNDMGLLILLFFTEETIDEIDYLVLAETQIEVGYRMEQYLTPAELGRIVDETLLSETYEDDLDMSVMYMVFELLQTIYLDCYGYEVDYDMDAFEEYLINHPDVSGDDSHLPLGFIFYLMSPFANSSDRLGAIISVIIFVVLGGGGLIVKNKGGGGSSGGMGIFRRR